MLLEKIVAGEFDSRSVPPFIFGFENTGLFSSVQFR